MNNGLAHANRFLVLCSEDTTSPSPDRERAGARVRSCEIMEDNNLYEVGLYGFSNM